MALHAEERQCRLALAQQRSTAGFFVQALGVLVIFGALGVAAYQALAGRISLGDLTAIYLGVQIGLNSLQAILQSLAGLYEDNLFLSHFYQFLEIQPRIQTPPEPRAIPDPLTQGVRFESVSFNYPNSRERVLDGVNLALRPGQVIALVGANGSGKTTLIKLLCELYFPSSGKVSVDGFDLTEVDPLAWRRRISVVFQDFVHYHLTAGENIWLGDAGQPYDLEKVKRAPPGRGRNGDRAPAPGLPDFPGNLV